MLTINTKIKLLFIITIKSHWGIYLNWKDGITVTWLFGDEVMDFAEIGISCINARYRHTSEEGYLTLMQGVPTLADSPVSHHIERVFNWLSLCEHSGTLNGAAGVNFLMD